MQFKGKLMNEIWENGKKLNFGPDFGLFDPNLGLSFFFQVLHLLIVTYCSKLSSYVIQRKTNESNTRKWQKT